MPDRAKLADTILDKIVLGLIAGMLLLLAKTYADGVVQSVARLTEQQRAIEQRVTATQEAIYTTAVGFMNGSREYSAKQFESNSAEFSAWQDENLEFGKAEVALRIAYGGSPDKVSKDALNAILSALKELQDRFGVIVGSGSEEVARNYDVHLSDVQTELARIDSAFLLLAEREASRRGSQVLRHLTTPEIVFLAIGGVLMIGLLTYAVVFGSLFRREKPAVFSATSGPPPEASAPAGRS